MRESTTSQTVLPGQALQTDKMPGHWLLAKLGKRVLRPGGIELTQRMLDALKVHSRDKVVEFAPGLGLTADRLRMEGTLDSGGVQRASRGDSSDAFVGTAALPTR